MDLKLEVVILPVSDVDHAKQFYKGLGWREDTDISAGDDFRHSAAHPAGVGVLDQLRHRRHADDPRNAAGTPARHGRYRGRPR